MLTVTNTDELELEEIVVPGDLSSAAFLIAAGVLVGGSRLLIRGTGVNWTRPGSCGSSSGWAASCSATSRSPATTSATTSRSRTSTGRPVR